MLLSEAQIEAQLADAARRGEFDDLPGAGRPLELDDDRDVPEDMRMAFRIMKNSGYVPEEVRLRGEIASVEALLREAEDSAGRERHSRRLRVLLDRLARERGRSGGDAGLATESGYFRALCARLDGE
ncbi:DUF1992 domain-containing protein [Thioalkalivibrio sp. ALE11]|uniref:DnaJ family domain-containing protein n=1 Tax=Thioalkalivibrio sp. ALE11 TaxID=1265494 RepID=UPI00039A352F|nr:DUF1992 domain-containing protein [Thioalkalivibrio sp. ALE11]